MIKTVIDGKYIRDEKTFHRTVKRLFQLDDYYGENLDALWDMLTERKNLNIKIINSKSIIKYLGDYGLKIINLFNELNRVDENFKVRIY